MTAKIFQDSVGEFLFENESGAHDGIDSIQGEKNLLYDGNMGRIVCFGRLFQCS